jgi:hypothetical protein
VRADDHAVRIADQRAAGLRREQGLGETGHTERIGETEQKGEEDHRDDGGAQMRDHGSCPFRGSGQTEG